MSEQYNASESKFLQEPIHSLIELSDGVTTEAELNYHLTIGATPIGGIEYPDVKKMQNDIVYPELIRRTIRGGMYTDTPVPIRAFALRSFMNRFVMRDAKNYDSFAQRLEQMPPEDMSPELFAIYEKTMRGTASPESLIVIRRTLGMAAIELSRLTHPYGVNIELLTPMREAVRRAIVHQNGIIFEPSDYNEQYKIRSSDLLSKPGQKNEAMALLMTRRRRFGLLSDDTLILERSSFILPIYEGSEYDPTLSRNMRNVPMVNNYNRIKELEEAGELHKVVPALLTENNFKAAIPLSTTIFGFNKTTDDLIKSRENQNRSHEALETIRRLTRESAHYDRNTIDNMRKIMDEEAQGQK